jgi:hypothetical protein
VVTQLGIAYSVWHQDKLPQCTLVSTAEHMLQNASEYEPRLRVSEAGNLAGRVRAEV